MNPINRAVLFSRLGSSHSSSNFRVKRTMPDVAHTMMQTRRYTDRPHSDAWMSVGINERR